MIVLPRGPLLASGAASACTAGTAAGGGGAIAAAAAVGTDSTVIGKDGAVCVGQSARLTAAEAVVGGTTSIADETRLGVASARGASGVRADISRTGVALG